MRDITHKVVSLRVARAVAQVHCQASTIAMVVSDGLPKGNLFDVARAAAFLGAKQTPLLLPHCHPVGIDGMEVTFTLIDAVSYPAYFNDSQLPAQGILIEVEAKSIGRTGIEMEALTAVSVAALEVYDMLKPVDNGLVISGVKLEKKTGGKSDWNKYLAPLATCAVLVCSDSTYQGSRQDKSGLKVRSMVEETGARVVDYQVVPDDKEAIQGQLKAWVEAGVQFIFTTGGTGLGPRDVTVEAVAELIEKKAEGIAEAMRQHGQMRTPLAMMSRLIAGTIGQALVLTLPGSTNGVKESLEAVLPAVFHAKKMLAGGGHE